MIGDTDILDLDRSCHAEDVWDVGSARKVYLGDCLCCTSAEVEHRHGFKSPCDICCQAAFALACEREHKSCMWWHEMHVIPQDNGESV
jgi:hypothetical protein